MPNNTILLSHGAGGKLSANLINTIFQPAFDNNILNRMDDQAIVYTPQNRVAFTTDSFVVDPIFFPGGDIGELAVYGTVNDLSMCGAMPSYLSVSFILEEGLNINDLKKIVLSMSSAAKRANIQIVTGDTKVVNKGSCDKIFINTSGIGVIEDNININPRQISVGDKIIISGTIADHGMSIMTTRNNLSFESNILSDTAPLNLLVKDMLKSNSQIHALRDPTRGGVATSLNEFAIQANLGINIYYDKLAIKPNVKGACEILGIDPLYVANEGKLIAVVPDKYAETVLQTMKENELGINSAIIGEVVSKHPGIVTMKTSLGVNRIVDMPTGNQLPRIC